MLYIFAVSLLTLSSAADAKPPNVIVIFTDDHGWSDLGAQGIQQDLRTPNLDALAAGGVRATNGYVTAPQCVPSRAGILSGRHQNRFGVESNGESLDGFNAQLTIAERLKRAGYATGMTGKWHLGPAPEIVSHGFDDVYYKNANRPGWANFDLDGKDRDPGPENSGLYHLDANSAAACAFIGRHHDQPFFFYCAYRAPHVPLDAPPKYLNRFPGKMPERRRQALAMISAIDDGVGEIMNTLREFDLEERTLIFMIGDNGAPLKIHKLDAPGGGPGWDGSLNEPLNGEKGMLSEGGIRVPWLAYWKGTIPPGQDYDAPVISLDVAATALALAGQPADPQLDGVNLIPYLTGEALGPPHKTLYWRWIAQSAIRDGDWKLLIGGQREYLFDLGSDPEEQRNLADEHPEMVESLRVKLQDWAADLQPPGIGTKPMSQTWENYYDFYLDGKPAPSPSPRRNSSSASGWIARNSTTEVRDGVLRIQPAGSARQRPFIACSQMKIPGPVTATMKIRASQGGVAGFAWRLDGQKDFASGQVVTADVPKSGDWQTVECELPADGVVIHVRALLPEGASEIRQINLKAKTGNAARQWSFEGP